jgi:hypothetical protein
VDQDADEAAQALGEEEVAAVVSDFQAVVDDKSDVDVSGAYRGGEEAEEDLQIDWHNQWGLIFQNLRARQPAADKEQDDDEEIRGVGQGQSPHGLPLVPGQVVDRVDDFADSERKKKEVQEEKTVQERQGYGRLQLVEEEEEEEEEKEEKEEKEPEPEEGDEEVSGDERQDGAVGLAKEKDKEDEENKKEEEYEGVGQPEEVPVEGRPTRIRRKPLTLVYDKLGNPSHERI